MQNNKDFEQNNNQAFCKVQNFLYKTVVIKVGTNVLTNSKGYLNNNSIQKLVQTISYLKQNRAKIILVSSGAVGAGKSILHGYHQIADKTVAKQILASIGQVKLIHSYAELFAKEKVIASQILVTKEDFRDRKHYLNLKNCLKGLLKSGVIPIINENDAISVNTITFTDNDELAGLIAAMVDSEAVIILTSVDGLFRGNPNEPDSQLIPQIDPEDIGWKEYILPIKSSLGRGGMATKCQVAEKNSKLGIVTHFINGNNLQNLINLMNGKKIGTKFLPQKNLSSRKKWLGNNLGFEKGCIYLDNGAQKVILDNPKKAKSVLPIGVVEFEGEFEKGDIIKVCNQQKITMGFGVAQYNYKILQKSLGQKNQKPLIRWDDLFLNNV
jgi:glutamate 5-kinase